MRPRICGELPPPDFASRLLGAIAGGAQAFESLDTKLARIADAAARGSDDPRRQDFLDESGLPGIVQRPASPIEGHTHQLSGLGSKARVLE